VVYFNFGQVYPSLFVCLYIIIKFSYILYLLFSGVTEGEGDAPPGSSDVGPFLEMGPP